VPVGAPPLDAPTVLVEPPAPQAVTRSAVLYQIAEKPYLGVDARIERVA
jgi:hypothetical protein